MKFKIPFIAFFSLFFAACDRKSDPVNIKPDEKTVPGKHETITLGGGCYWCVEAVFQQLDGVISSTSGFMGGHVPNPTYQQVCEEETGHIEVIQVVYDPTIISTETIIEWFWNAHDPTNPLGQGNDIGEAYTSNLFYHTEEQKKIAEASKAAAQKQFDKPIVTKIRKAETFYKAMESHQDYYAQNKNKNPYCQIITKKLKKLKLEY
ncbi:peptide-methionine (S)-S-oxide reductase MsrA [Verrucomicrobiaceae bacterium 227]